MNGGQINCNIFFKSTFLLSMTTLKNNFFEVSVDAHGAELTSVRTKNDDFLWCGDKAYWGRHAPILFPIVGKVWNDEYRVDGEVYRLGQHGFARDMDFELVDSTATEATLVLRSSQETLAKYPYPFELTAHYVLKKNGLEMEWRVANKGEKPMYYQIGAHPAFLYRDFDSQDERHGYLQLLRDGKVVESGRVSRLGTLGVVGERGEEMVFEEGRMALTDELFMNDALIFEDSQADGAVLLDKEGRPYLRVGFEGSPVLGVWSPKGRRAPFVCIEPWKGRADAEGFVGDIAQREWIQHLAAGGQQVFRYEIGLM